MQCVAAVPGYASSEWAGFCRDSASLGCIGVSTRKTPAVAAIEFLQVTHIMFSDLRVFAALRTARPKTQNSTKVLPEGPQSPQEQTLVDSVACPIGGTLSLNGFSPGSSAMG